MIKKSKSFLILYLLALVILTSACGMQDEEAETEITVEDEDNGIIETEDDAIEEEGQTGESEVYIIDDEDALSLVKEKLTEGLEAKMYGSITKDEKSYYLFEITKDGTTLSQMLAVNDESGEVYTYDDNDASINPYSDFEYYEASSDGNIDWNGVYENENYKVVIENTDPGNIEYNVSKGEKSLYVNVASFKDYVTAFGSTEEYGELTFSLDGKKLSIQSEKDCEFSGEYKIK